MIPLSDVRQDLLNSIYKTLDRSNIPWADDGIELGVIGRVEWALDKLKQVNEEANKYIEEAIYARKVSGELKRENESLKDEINKLKAKTEGHQETSAYSKAVSDIHGLLDSEGITGQDEKGKLYAVKRVQILAKQAADAKKEVEKLKTDVAKIHAKLTTEEIPSQKEGRSLTALERVDLMAIEVEIQRHSLEEVGKILDSLGVQQIHPQKMGDTTEHAAYSVVERVKLLANHVKELEATISKKEGAWSDPLSWHASMTQILDKMGAPKADEKGRTYAIIERLHAVSRLVQFAIDALS